MSLRADYASTRSRSKSRTRERSRSHSHVRPKSPPKVSSYSPEQASAVGMPMSSNTYERKPSPPANAYPSSHLPYPVSGGIPYPMEPSDIDMGDYTDYPPEERAARRAAAAQFKGSYDEDLAYGSLPAPPPTSGRQHSASVSSQNQSAYGRPRTSSASYRYTPTTITASQPGYAAYAQPEPYQYAKPPSKIAYTSKAQTAGSRSSSTNGPITYTTTRAPVTASQRAQSPPSSGQFHPPSSPRSSHARIVEVTPGVSKQSSLLSPQMDRLNVSGLPHEMSGGLPPPSPLLEAYHGTYQSISPMPSPMMLAHDGDFDEVPPLSRLSSSTNITKHDGGKHRRSKSHSISSGSKHRKTASFSSSSNHVEKPEKKRAKVYDAEEDAKIINEALSHHRGPDIDPLCDILPHLTHDQILELRNEYKKIAKVSGRGVNIAKHIKMKLGGNFGKAAYVTALGRWESEGYWANFWYQSHGSRRELLIESLMGRTNAEIRQIKDSFRDKRYSDDLVKCMEKELKADKFRLAILTSLEERRQEETDVYPREYVDNDAAILYRCILSREGGESSMLGIITRRSDAHLREVLKTYERQYQSNFARQALQKSNNLVGEVIAHILNGVINKPARDALLLRHAIKDIKSHNQQDELRYELLISRLVRLHWDRAHLARVRREYGDKYGRRLEDDVEDATRGEFREFVIELCLQQGVGK